MDIPQGIVGSIDLRAGIVLISITVVSPRPKVISQALITWETVTLVRQDLHIPNILVEDWRTSHSSPVGYPVLFARIDTQGEVTVDGASVHFVSCIIARHASARLKRTRCICIDSPIHSVGRRNGHR